jgi:cytochrome c-type biogenesis protein CcmH
VSAVASPRRRALAGLIALATGLAMIAPGLASAAVTRASLTDIENDVMCVACHESLAVAQSPEAYSEISYIRGLIAQGETKRQIERQLVAQYGESVLGKPPAHGFNLVVYVVPPALVALALITLVVTLPKWRRRAREAAPLAAGPRLSPDDTRRLDEELARYT